MRSGGNPWNATDMEPYMAVSRGDAIRVATEFANSNGYRVVPSFAEVEWAGTHGPRPVQFGTVRMIDNGWAVLFNKMLPPEVESEDPSETCVVVSPETGDCRFFPLL